MTALGGIAPAGGNKLVDETGAPFNAQNPVPTDGDFIYTKDVDFVQSEFIGWTGDPEDLFNDYNKGIYNDNVTNPKEIKLIFKNPIISTGFALTTTSGLLRNTDVFIILADDTEVQIYSYLAATTPAETTRIFAETVEFSSYGMRIAFNSADRVDVQLVNEVKNTQVIARMRAASDINGVIESVQSHKNRMLTKSAYDSIGRQQKFFRLTGDSTTLTADAVKGDIQISVADETGFIAGGMLQMVDSVDGFSERPAFKATIVAAGLITLDRPVARTIVSGSAVDEISTNMAVVGSLASPVIFQVKPPAGEVWELTRALIGLLHDSSGDLSLFGNITALINGVCLRVVRDDGTIDTVAMIRRNFDMSMLMFDVGFDDRAAPPAGQFSTTGRWTFTKAEFAPKIDGDTSDVIQALIQDDLTTGDPDITDFEINLQGNLFN